MTHTARGRCGGAFTAATPGARIGADGRWIMRAGDTAKGWAAAPEWADLDLDACPVALARDVWASGLPFAEAAGNIGASLEAAGVRVLSEGGLEAIAASRAAWGTRRNVEAEVERQRAAGGKR